MKRNLPYLILLILLCSYGCNKSGENLKLSTKEKSFERIGFPNEKRTKEARRFKSEFIDLEVKFIQFIREGKMTKPFPDSVKAFEIEASIVNRSRDTLTFKHMVCGKDAYFKTNSPEIFRFQQYYFCFMEGFTEIKIAPKERYSNRMHIKYNKKYDSKLPEFRIGFLLQGKEKDSLTIWSRRL